MNHQQYIEAVRDIAIARLNEEDRAKLRPFKLVYGAGSPMLRGVTYFSAWSNGEPEPEEMVEICAFGESNPVQLAGTTIHEIGHVLAGLGAGHQKGWVEACEKLGLRRIHAAGTYYQPAMFAPDIRSQLAKLPVPTDGKPARGAVNGHWSFSSSTPPSGWSAKPCSSTHGCKGGKSRGKGSGSRMLKAVCPNEDCELRDGDKPYTIRLTRKWADAGMPSCPCGTEMELEG